MLQQPLFSAGTAPFNGQFRPEQAFSTLNPAINPNGTWTLRMVDELNTGFTAFLTVSVLVSPTEIAAEDTMTQQSQRIYGFKYAKPGYCRPNYSKWGLYVTFTAGNGCTASDTASVIVNQPPTTAAAGPDQINCSSGSFS